MAKTIIYQLLPRLFSNTTTGRVKNGTLAENGSGKLNDINEAALKGIADLGVSHVWYTGVIRHASVTDYPFISVKSNPNVVKGKAGSPYAICDYYDIDPDLATDVDRRLDEWMELVNRTHKAGLKVIMDFVPNHVARQYHSDARTDVPQFGDGDEPDKAFSPGNNFYYMPGADFHAPVSDLGEPYHENPAKASGNDAFTPSPSVYDWYETVKLNYGRDYTNGIMHTDPRPDTWSKMRDILLYWIETGIDGFRVDMAEMVPVEFWQWVIRQIRVRNPQVVFIAETYNIAQYKCYSEAGFNLLYDKVNYYDTVRDVVCGNKPASDITHIWHTNESVERSMLYFLENHDEQRVASDFFAGDALKGRPAYILTATMGHGGVMLYAGQELGEKGMDEEGFSGRDGRTTIFDYWNVDTLTRYVNGLKYDGGQLTDDEKALRKWYEQVGQVVQRYEALATGDFYDLMWINQHIWVDASKLYAFLRYDRNNRFLIAVNFANSPRRAILRIPADAWRLMGSTWNECIQPSDMLGNAVYIGRESVNNIKERGLEIVIPAHDGVILSF
ncbi:MAG: alpha-amylase family protein [Bacteroidales bacterium]|nr:alpha-amylase family protein [Bacteroidales bacterium]